MPNLSQRNFYYSIMITIIIVFTVVQKWGLGGVRCDYVLSHRSYTALLFLYFVNVSTSLGEFPLATNIGATAESTNAETISCDTRVTDDTRTQPHVNRDKHAFTFQTQRTIS